MFLRSYCSLCAIRVIWEELFTQCGPHFIHITRQAYVVFLVHGFKFGVETTYNHVLETVRLNTCPRRNLIAWYVFNVTRLVITREGITTFTTDGSHHFIILVWNIILGSKL